MSKAIPEIVKYMTMVPHSIGSDQALSQAEKLMRENKIRHLPVLKGGKILGIISDRDLKITEALVGGKSSTMKVEDITQGEPYTCTPHSKLDEVATTMAENKYGSALVIDNNKLVGIFTAVDALRALSDLLHTRLKS
jgi:acetoin utilization protein AcuB